MRNYIDLSQYYPSQVTFGKFNLKTTPHKMKASNGVINFYGVGDFNNEFPLQYNLQRNQSEHVMDNGPFELITNKHFIDNANGDVLIFGLGMGMIVYPLLLDTDVTSITIIEIDQDIIDYVGGIVKENDPSNKVTIIQGDAMTYHEQMVGQVFDFIYFDYWDLLNDNAFNEMAIVKQLYSPNKKNPDSVIYSWCEDIRNLIP